MGRVNRVVVFPLSTCRKSGGFFRGMRNSGTAPWSGPFDNTSARSRNRRRVAASNRRPHSYRRILSSGEAPLSYVLNTPADRAAMLKVIGAASIDNLLKPIPPDVRLDRPLDLPLALPEMELTRHVQALAARNA